MKIAKLLFNKLPKRKTLIKFLYPLGILFIIISLYHVVFARRIIPGVYIGNIHVGGMTFTQAKTVVQDYINSNSPSLELRYGTNSFLIKPEDIGLVYSVDDSVTRAFEVGRTGNLILDSKDKIGGILKKLQVKAFYEVDDNSLNIKFSQIKGELNKPAVNAGYEIKDNKVVLLSASIGKQVDDQNLYEKVIFSLDNIDFSTKDILVEDKRPEIANSDIESFAKEVEKIVFNPIKITYGERIWTLTSDQKLEIIAFTKEDNQTQISLNKTKFEAYLDVLGQEINQLPRGKVTQTDGDKVVGFEITQSGKELNTKKFSEDFKKAYLSAQPTVEVSINEIEATNLTEKYGIFALLGSGKSVFTGSIAGRINNLILAAERTSGVLVPPGTIYSFNKTIGEISGKTGYDTAYIISNGRTVLGEGGGVCQTSTTLFRAVLNTGLPVVTRYPHAYRVSYYEKDSPVGFDAAIFQPSLDFQFKNDTPNYILVQAYPDRANNSLEFKIYGTPDGRTVEISNPIVTNVTNAPEAMYQDDPTLEKGKIVQVDWAAGGANVSFSRTVKLNDKVLYQDTFSSRYQPWRAVYLRGTKD